jgi:hypothetical protein
MKKTNMKIWPSTTHRLLDSRNAEKKKIGKRLLDCLVYVFIFGRINTNIDREMLQA